jgi:hypothetical protein
MMSETNEQILEAEVRDKDAEIDRLRAKLAVIKALHDTSLASCDVMKVELADMREIAENWEIKAKQTDIKLAAWQHARQDVERMQEAILSMIPSLDRLITDYQCVPDASDSDGQSVFDDARTALAKARAALQDATGTPKPEK